MKMNEDDDERPFPLTGYGKKYLVTPRGIWSNRTKKYLTISSVLNGYNMVRLFLPKSKKSLRHRVDLLIAMAFMEKSDNFLYHKDGNDLNDHQSNLEWIDAEVYLVRKYEGSRWKSIPEHPKYYISDKGQVWSQFSRKLMIPTEFGEQYVVRIGKPKKTFKVRRLVANAFLPKIDGKDDIISKDNDKLNCRVENLKWATHSETIIFGKEHNKGKRAGTRYIHKSEEEDEMRELSDYEEYERYEGYFACKSGHIYSKKQADDYLIETENRSGRLEVSLSVNGEIKTHKVHRLIGHLFLEKPPPEKTEIDHKDGNPKNNSVKNLHWITKSENTKRDKRLNPEQHKHLQKAVIQMDKDNNFIEEFASLGAASRATKINNGSISAVCRKMKGTHTAGGYKWKFK